MNQATRLLSYADISNQHVFTGNQEIHIQIPFWYVISNCFKVFCVAEDCFHKHGYNLHGYNLDDPRSSSNKGTLK